MRIFLAVFPSPEVQETAFAVVEALRPRGEGVSWVKRENLHFTLRFLGEVGDDGARRAIKAAEAAAAATTAFEASLGACGAFPSPRRARVLWLGLAEGGPRLVALAKHLQAALAGHGFEPEGRGFSPHLTIGRVREPGFDWSAALVSANPSEGAARAFRVGKLDVVRSQLHPRGSIYTVLQSPPLASG